MYMNTFVYIYIWICAYMHPHIYVHTYIHIYVYFYIYMHTPLSNGHAGSTWLLTKVKSKNINICIYILTKDYLSWFSTKFKLKKQKKIPRKNICLDFRRNSSWGKKKIRRNCLDFRRKSSRSCKYSHVHIHTHAYIHIHI